MWCTCCLVSCLQRQVQRDFLMNCATVFICNLSAKFSKVFEGIKWRARSKLKKVKVSHKFLSLDLKVQVFYFGSSCSFFHLTTFWFVRAYSFTLLFSTMLDVGICSRRTNFTLLISFLSGKTQVIENSPSGIYVFLDTVFCDIEIPNIIPLVVK